MVSTTKKKISERQGSVSAIIAFYKDAQAIPIMHNRLTDTFRKLGIDYEIIFVNDCSPDDSAQVIRDISAQDPRVLGISHSRNSGALQRTRLSPSISFLLVSGGLGFAFFSLVAAFFQDNVFPGLGQGWAR